MNNVEKTNDSIQCGMIENVNDLILCLFAPFYSHFESEKKVGKQ